MQHRDDCVAFRINNENHAIHSFPISRWNAVRQSSELSATDHERSTPPADKWTAVGIAVNCLQNSHRNAPCLRTPASVIGQNQRRYGWLIYLHDPISLSRRAMPLRLQGRRAWEFSYTLAGFFWLAKNPIGGGTQPFAAGG
jgi:hypothetical protein